jgi:2-oxoisovalerate ferredoxin oxidoreductase beta subunit
VTTFYERFERHDHGEGLKASCTHYCAGCGHGLAHRYLAEAIEALGVQDRAVAVSPVGCAAFLYYYLDVSNVAAAHGRASAVAVGQKLAHPESVVVSYQGDGDLAAIGLAEIMHAAQLGLPISVVYVNNAVYGMTGGQMAPTTLVGQRTTTSPRGRDRTMGLPLRMAEQLALLDGPVYVERVALFDARQRERARRAIRRALECQVENRGFSFVEVLAECPTHLRLTPLEAERWVRETMLPTFPLGVKKDVPGAAWGAWPTSSFEPEAILAALGARAGEDAEERPVERRAGAGRTALGLKLAGAGGDGAQTAAMLIARAAVEEGLDVTHIPSYGPESRGGTSYADVRLAHDEVLSPEVPSPDALVAFNAPSLARFGPSVRERGLVVYDATVIADRPALPASVRALGVPATKIAADLGHPRVKNLVALGALQAALGPVSDEALLRTLRQTLGKSPALAAVNEEAFRRGAEAGGEFV